MRSLLIPILAALLVGSGATLLVIWLRGRRTPEQDRLDRYLADELAHRVARRHGLVGHAIMTSNRCRSVVDARQELCVELRNRGWSLPRIGRAIERDHAAVFHLLRRRPRPHFITLLQETVA